MTDKQIELLNRIERKVEESIRLQKEAREHRQKQIDLLANLAEECEYRNQVIDELQSVIREAMTKEDDSWWKNGAEPPSLDFD